MSNQTQQFSQEGPDLVSPLGSHLDAAAATFQWAAQEGRSYELEVARDEQFNDVVVSLGAGKADSLTLYELIPTTGQRMYWRVRDTSGQSGWSTGSFISSNRNDEPAESGKGQRAGAAGIAGTAATAGSAHVHTTAHTSGAHAGAVGATVTEDVLEQTIDGSTSQGLAIGAVVLMFVSFIALLLILQALS